MAYYLIKHSKDDEVKFTGHLDLTKAIQRIIDRSNIGIMYSKGFNPHMLLSSAQPVPVGQLSKAEYILAELDTEKEPERILESLNENSPKGIEFLFIRKLENGKKTPMGMLSAIDYEILIPGDEKFLDEVRRLILKSTWNIRTVSKKGVERDLELREKIINISAENIFDSDSIPYVRINLTAVAGSQNHLSTDHFLQYIKENTKLYPIDKFIKVTRLEMYTMDGNELKSMEEM